MDWVKQELVILVKRSELSGSAASLLVNTSSDQRILSDTPVWSVPGSWSLTEGDISSVVVNNNTEKYAAPVSRNLLSQEHNCSCDKYRGAWTRFLQNKLIFLGDTRCQHLVEEKQHPAQISKLWSVSVCMEQGKRRTFTSFSEDPSFIITTCNCWWDVLRVWFWIFESKRLNN